jgi:hypothetical protein
MQNFSFSISRICAFDIPWLSSLLQDLIANQGKVCKVSLLPFVYCKSKN